MGPPEWAGADSVTDFSGSRPFLTGKLGILLLQPGALLSRVAVFCVLFREGGADSQGEWL